MWRYWLLNLGIFCNDYIRNQVSGSHFLDFYMFLLIPPFLFLQVKFFIILQIFLFNKNYWLTLKPLHNSHLSERISYFCICHSSAMQWAAWELNILTDNVYAKYFLYSCMYVYVCKWNICYAFASLNRPRPLPTPMLTHCHKVTENWTKC